jgi:hypothetical protein
MAQLRYPTHVNAIYDNQGLIAGPVDIPASCTPGNSTVCSQGEILQWSLDTLSPGQTVHLSLPPTVTNGTVDGTLIPWEVTVSDDSRVVSTESTTLIVDNSPALTVAIDEDLDPVPAVETVTYTVRYGNRATNSITGTNLRFTLPDYSNFISATGGGMWDANTNTVNWDLATLASGEVAQQLIEVSIDSSISNGTLLHSEAIIGGSNIAQQKDQYATETTYVGTGSPLSLSLNVTPLPAQGNQQLQIGMTVNNPTSSTIYGGVVRLRYPSNVNAIYDNSNLITGPIDIPASCIAGNATVCSQGDILQWTLGTLTPGQTVDLSLLPTVTSGTTDGNLIPWEAIAHDDSSMITYASSTLPIGIGCITDSDGDGICDDDDNCTQEFNPDQRDTDGDNFGNRCDADLDNSGFVNSVDLGLFKNRFFTADPDADFDGDGIVNAVDLGIFKQYFTQPPGPSGLAP